MLLCKAEIAGYPFAGISNETGFYGGALTYLRYRPAHFDSTVAKNNFYFSSAYSEKKQINFFFEPTLYFSNGKYKFIAEIEFKKWPSEFYGIGMETDSDKYEKFTSNEKDVKLILSWKFSSIWNLSFNYEFLDYQISKMDEDGILDNGNFINNNKPLNSGLGFTIKFDDRNCESYPAKGGAYSFQLIQFSKYLRSDHQFSRITFDLRKYVELNKKHILAFQSYFSSISGDVPFYQLNYLNDSMRAITSNLYLDRNIYVFRMEDRFFPWNDGFNKRLGFAIFTELGEVSPKISKLNLEQLQFNYGIGFRYSFFLDNRMNARFDIGFGEIKASISMATGEVF